MHYVICAYLLCLLLVSAALWHICVVKLSPRLGLVKPNFRKQPILASYGLIAFPYIAAIVGALWYCQFVEKRYAHLYLAAMGAMWVLGAIDDIWGSRAVGGFKGHFRMLIREHKLTTGALKALGGGVVALVAAWSVYGSNPVKWLLSSAVIALATNTLNLLDLRPGRAVAVLFSGLGVTYIVARGRLVVPLIVATVTAVMVIFGIVDSRGKAMMGDSGSNALGAALGLTIVLNAPNWMLPAIAILAAIHIYSEKRSISALIERNSVLRAIDRCLGVR